MYYKTVAHRTKGKPHPQITEENIITALTKIERNRNHLIHSRIVRFLAHVVKKERIIR